MNILVACDSYKGCMTSKEANFRIQKGFRQASDQYRVRTFPVADGGEGLVDAFIELTNARRIEAQTVDLYGKPITACIGYEPETKTACIEAASVAGLCIYPEKERHPLQSSSYGLGLLMKEAMMLDTDRLIIGLGGTGSNDGGIGLLTAFGAVLYDAAHKRLDPVTQNLGKVAFIDKRKFQFNRKVHIEAACDVKNPLLGPNGATHIYGKQKGLAKTEQTWVEEGMKRFEAKVDQTFHVSMNSFAGAGAAGGLGGMLLGVFKASFIPGIELLAQIGNLDEKI
ncbi:MAG: glycerate kinase, partial [Erysipelotrichaceae bacterium]|nr:glycerate kinase [Erysipelotrichaceae bacterium]